MNILKPVGAMHKELIIDSSHGEIRVALVENGRLVELYIEQEDVQHYAGNIYKGRVEDVLPGLGSAFVDIGHDKRGFLHASDVLLTGIEDIDEFFAGQASPASPRGSIGGALRGGQDITVQVTKEAIGDKGPKLTTAISIPGRYVVLMPYADRVNISSRLEDEATRDRLRALVEGAGAAPHGFIVRTVAGTAEPEAVLREIENLVQTWRRIAAAAERKTAPALLYKDKDLLERILRDLFTADVDVMITDAAATYERVTALAEKYAPPLAPRVRLYDDEHPVFDAFGIEAEIDRMFRRKIWLRSGGYIIIDEAEALVAIDVNTGRFLGRYDQEETILKTNLEAAAEIARQVRLRNIGGIIIVDFIDMATAEHKDHVLAALKDHMSHDRARAKILGFSELGMVEMTRQRHQGSIAARLSRPCPYCRGRGTVLDFEVVGVRLERELDRRFHAGVRGELTVFVHPRVKEYLELSFASRLSRIEADPRGHIRLVGRDDLPLDALEITARGADGIAGGIKARPPFRNPGSLDNEGGG
jgi:ribonuclease G